MCIRDRPPATEIEANGLYVGQLIGLPMKKIEDLNPVSYTHLRAHETVLDLVCRLLLEKKKSLRYITSQLS